MGLNRNTSLLQIGGTDTFRLASKALLKSPWFPGWGTNLQNIEKSARRMYVADPGKKLGQVDQSGAEALIVAYLCRAGKFRQLFENKIKPHVFVAIHLFPDVWQQEMNIGSKDIKFDINEIINCAIEDLTKHPYWKQLDYVIKLSDNWEAKRRYYYMSKQVCHSSNYGIKARMFSLNVLEKSMGKVVITVKQAEKFLEIYHGLFPEIREWHAQVRKQIETARTLYTLQGFPKYFQFSGNIPENDFKKCYAFIPQGTVACITRTAYILMQQFIEENKMDWDLLTDTHDSYLLQFPVEEEIQCMKIAKSFMEQELVGTDGTKFRMRAEAAAGFNWAPYHETKNPEGLRELKI